VRRVHVLAAAGAALLLAGCSNHPNDLRDNRYYRDSEPSEQPSVTASVTGQPLQAAPATKPAIARPVLDLFALTAQDLADEGVQPTGTDRTLLKGLDDCAVPVDGAKATYRTTWAYPTGATLRQYVANFDADASAVVNAVRTKLTCGKYGAEVTVRAPVTAADGQVSWCATSTKQSTCTVLRANGSMLSVLTVTAATENKAKQAVTRIAPLAATALTRNS
jgi:hypothetical protein